MLTQFANGIQLTSANEVAIKYLECLAFALETINNSYNLGCSIWTGRNADEQFIQQGEFQCTNARVILRKVYCH